MRLMRAVPVAFWRPLNEAAHQIRLGNRVRTIFAKMSFVEQPASYLLQATYEFLHAGQRTGC
jgi:hypothetical protein